MEKKDTNTLAEDFGEATSTTEAGKNKKKTAKNLAALKDGARNISEVFDDVAKAKTVKGAILALRNLNAEGLKAMTSLGLGAAALQKQTGFLTLGLQNLFTVTKENIFALNEAQSAMAKATGQGNRWKDSIKEIRNKNREYGVTLEDVGNAFGSIHNNMTMTNKLTDPQFKSVVELSSAWEKLGVSYETTGKIQDSLMHGLRVDAPTAIKIQKDLLNTAVKLNIPVANMAEDFQASLGQLGAWGKDAPIIFKKVKMAAHNLGLSLDDILSTASQFDTFEGSAAAVGKLNAVLQVDFLNPYEMMGLDEEQRIRKINEALELSGTNFASLQGVHGKFMKQAIGEALGIKDMDKLNKLFNQGLKGHDEGQNKLKATKDGQDELTGSIKESVSAMERMKTISDDFAVSITDLSKALDTALGRLVKMNLAGKGIAPRNFLKEALKELKKPRGRAGSDYDKIKRAIERNTDFTIDENFIPRGMTEEEMKKRDKRLKSKRRRRAAIAPKTQPVQYASYVPDNTITASTMSATQSTSRGELYIDNKIYLDGGLLYQKMKKFAAEEVDQSVEV